MLSGLAGDYEQKIRRDRQGSTLCQNSCFNCSLCSRVDVPLKTAASRGRLSCGWQFQQPHANECPTPKLYAERVANKGLCAIAQCESLRYKLLGGLAVRRYVGRVARGDLCLVCCSSA